MTEIVEVLKRQNMLLQEELQLISEEIDQLKMLLDQITSEKIPSDSLNSEVTPYPPYVCIGDEVIYHNGTSITHARVEIITDSWIQIRELDDYLYPTQKFVRFDVIQAPTSLRKVTGYGN
tara:strand:+ start:1042 stop:1401 length:360 start_codon:yes stop_codon:yes gene_type:complete